MLCKLHISFSLPCLSQVDDIEHEPHGTSSETDQVSLAYLQTHANDFHEQKLLRDV